MRQLIVTVDEIATKGGNRREFERILSKNLWISMGRRPDVRPHFLFGRLAFHLPDEMSEEAILEAVLRVPGVARFSIARHTENDLEAIRDLALEVLQSKPGESFGVFAQRSWKEFPLNSQEIAQKIGYYLGEQSQLKVDLTKPDLPVHIQITEKGAYVSLHKERGIGGLPVGASGRVVALLSGGLDSPVAAYRMILRGCRVVFIHFLNQTQGGLEVQGKIEDLVRTVARFQQHARLYVIPFQGVQQTLVHEIPSGLRMLAYRRVMLRIASRLARDLDAEALVTGDSVGQVASQTLSNLQSVWSAVPDPILTPLIGHGKNEIISTAKEIGTFEISIQPYPDVCQFLIGKSPATRSRQSTLEELEGRIEDLEALEAKAYEDAEILRFEVPKVEQLAYPGLPRRRRKSRSPRRRRR